MEKYEETINLLTEKNKKYSQGNELLIKTLKTCEKELDKLAINNQTLHKNIIFLQEQVKEYETKEITAKELIMQQENVIVKLSIELL